MKLGILGSGIVGSTLGKKFVEVGHEVKMGARVANNEKAVAWAKSAGDRASQGTFADAAAFGEIVLNCTAGTGSVAAVQAAGPKNLAGKILIDVANPLDFSKGMPPSLTVCNTDSLGEQIQRACPDAKVVKALNTLSATVMVNPGLVPGEHDLFICGNDAGAKGRVTELLRESFGWKSVLDVGDITA
ncbi:MAG TPA: NAD(P)-binding domain-containing protein, partial [Polyangia bacterium]|nr:NAD(P)-binding domain-containing protein [Polyangia bacterium]